MFTFMPHIMAKFIKYIVRTFLVENPDTGQKYSFCNTENLYMFIHKLDQGIKRLNPYIGDS